MQKTPFQDSATFTSMTDALVTSSMGHHSTSQREGANSDMCSITFDGSTASQIFHCQSSETQQIWQLTRSTVVHHTGLQCVTLQARPR